MEKKIVQGGAGDGVFERLVEINRGIFAQGRFSAAYHALCAALHLAQEDGDLSRLEIVRALAHEQLGWIDAHAPQYKHSSESAAQRGHASVYLNLERQADAAILMIERNKQFLEIVRLRKPPP